MRIVAPNSLPDSAMTEPLLDDIEKDLWEEACRRTDAIREFMKRNPGQSTAADVADLSSELELSHPDKCN